MLTNKRWWKAALIRALKTVCQTAVATIGTAAVLESVNWLMVLSASALAGVLSLLTSLAGLPEVEDESGYHAVSDGWPVDDIDEVEEFSSTEPMIETEEKP